MLLEAGGRHSTCVSEWARGQCACVSSQCKLLPSQGTAEIEQRNSGYHEMRDRNQWTTRAAQIDAIRFHPAWQMRRGMAARVQGLPWLEVRPPHPDVKVRMPIALGGRKPSRPIQISRCLLPSCVVIVQAMPPGLVLSRPACFSGFSCTRRQRKPTVAAHSITHRTLGAFVTPWLQ